MDRDTILEEMLILIEHWREMDKQTLDEAYGLCADDLEKSRR